MNWSQPKLWGVGVYAWLPKIESCHKEKSFPFTLYWPNARQIGRKWILLFSWWLLKIQSNHDCPRRPRENNFHLSLRNICFQTYAVWSLQCTKDIPEVYDGHIFIIFGTISGSFYGPIFRFWWFLQHILGQLGRCTWKMWRTNLVLNWEKCHFMVNEGIAGTRFPSQVWNWIKLRSRPLQSCLPCQC